MLLKRTDKVGNKYYINAFTGQTVETPNVDPLKKEANPTLLQLMNPRFSNGYYSISPENNIKSAFVGEYKAIMRLKPEQRDKKEFILICKRVNVNPYILLSDVNWPTKRERQKLKKSVNV